jgi:hypothetical protein
MNRVAAAPLTLVVLALLLPACGGDDAPSKVEFASDAEKICKNAGKELRALTSGVSRAELADAIEKAIDRTQKSVDELKELDVPDGAAGEQAERFVDGIEGEIDRGVPALRDLAEAARDNDEAAARDAYRRLQQIEDTGNDKLARELGIEGCAT